MSHKSCECCGSEVNHEALYAEHKELFDAFDFGEIEEVTDLEEAIYFGTYCVACSREFLRKEAT